MCIIIAQPANLPEPVPFSIFQRCSTKNKDGQGFMYVDNDGTLRVVKQMNNIAAFYNKYIEAYRNSPESPFGIHFRIATHGAKNLANCHPFFVTPQVAVMHNGTFRDLGNAEVSDTRVYIKQYIKTLPENWTTSNTILEMMQSHITTLNKIVILDNNRRMKVLNEKAGSWDPETNCWYSNTGYKEQAFYGKTNNTYDRRSSTASETNIEQYYENLRKKHKKEAAKKEPDKKEADETEEDFENTQYIAWWYWSGSADMELLCSQCVPKEDWLRAVSQADLDEMSLCERCGCTILPWKDRP